MKDNRRYVLCCHKCGRLDIGSGGDAYPPIIGGMGKFRCYGFVNGTINDGVKSHLHDEVYRIVVDVVGPNVTLEGAMLEKSRYHTLAKLFASNSQE